ncbi:hypothetical protein G7Y89_g3970 [Cudoniella acicularis]|uniref:SET domain-containing protein n=1 Tax=Cudoniella acicularis TaxID=354080 RepID=A0A8H4RRQ3_9HELO|nr:hypothetical protein G7Y89_g3970 [Cudoniella acicularis]
MLFRYLVIEFLGVTMVLARGSEVDFGAQKQFSEQRGGLRFGSSNPLSGDSNGSNSCHAHNHDRTTLLSYNHHHHHHHHHNDLTDSTQTCPKVPTDPIEWPAGFSKPWTHTPFCTRIPGTSESSANGTTPLSKENSSFCVYTSATYRSGRGISVVTKPSIANEIAKLPAFNRKSSNLLGNQPPPYEIKYVVGKGMGVIANRTIFRGERLFAHSVIAIYHNEAFLTKRSREHGLRAKLMERGIEQLPQDARERFYAMIGQPGTENQVVGKLNVNTFGEEFGGEEHSMVVPETARMNHDCRPNAMYYFDRISLVHYTQASRTINAGEEITITYIDPLQSLEERQAAIERSWGFSCTCSLCTSPPTITGASDGRIATINRLVDLIRGAKTRAVDKDGLKPEQEVGMVDTLVSLYEQERLYAHIADAYVYAAKAYKRAGRAWEALRWAYKAEEAALVYDGPRHGAVRRMENLIEELHEELGLEVEGSVETGTSTS